MPLQKTLAKIETILQTIDLQLVPLPEKEFARKVAYALSVCTVLKFDSLLAALKEILSIIKSNPVLQSRFGRQALNLELLLQELHTHSLSAAIAPLRNDIINRLLQLEGMLERFELRNNKALTSLTQNFLETSAIVKPMITKTMSPAQEIQLVQYFSLLSEKMRGINIFLQEYVPAMKVQRELLLERWNELIDLISDTLIKTQQRIKPQSVALRGKWGGVAGIQLRG